MTHIIGITGKAKSGKDTVANYLRTQRGYHHMAMATPLRNALITMLGLNSGHFEHPNKETVLPLINKSPRQLLQLLGTEWGRQLVHPDIWVMLAMQQIEAVRKADAHANIIISDVRFENEAKMVRDLGGQVWHISRDGAGTPHAHSSESGIAYDKEDVVIYNNSSLADLHTKVVHFTLDWFMRRALVQQQAAA